MANPALNPVRELPAPRHAAVKLVEGGRPLFTIVWDSRAEAAAPLAAEHLGLPFGGADSGAQQLLF